MVAETSETAQDATREKLLAAAHEQFAQRGFYGASIALIAGEIGLTKQALLYHFKRKEDLYEEVLKRISQALLGTMRETVGPSGSAEEQFENLIVGLYKAASQSPVNSRILLRELLDNQRQDAPRDQWYFKTLIDEIIATLDAVDGMEAVPFPEKLARVYLLLSAINFSVASGQVLHRFYGDEQFEQTKTAFPDELRRLVKKTIERS